MIKKDSNIILKIGGEGGSIKLVKMEKDYYFTTDESAMMDMLPGEFEAHELKSTTGPFDQFEVAFEALMKKYSVFGLYPLRVSPDYANRISIYFEEYVKTDKSINENWHLEKWKKLIKSE